MTRPQIQSEIPGTEDPQRNPAMDERLWAYLDAKDEQRRKAADTKLKLTVLFAAMLEAGIDRYAYTDRFSGKKRWFVADKTPKPKTTNVPKAKKAKDERKDERKAEKAAEKRKRESEENQVEHRTVPREQALRELNRPAPPVEDADPFAHTRAAMEPR